jgi:hypothetical protein
MSTITTAARNRERAAPMRTFLCRRSRTLEDQTYVRTRVNGPRRYDLYRCRCNKLKPHLNSIRVDEDARSIYENEQAGHRQGFSIFGQRMPCSSHE